MTGLQEIVFTTLIADIQTGTVVGILLALAIVVLRRD